MKIFCTVVFCAVIFTISVSAQQASNLPEKTQWVSSVIQEIEKIKPGMTRVELLKTFGEEGGLSTGLQQTYVFHDCPYIKVDVTFEAVGRPAKDKAGRVTLVEDKRDIIKSISKPYLQFSVID